MLRQFVTATVRSLVLNVNGQDQPMVLKFLQIPQFVENYSLVKLIRLLSIYCLDMIHYLITSLEILLTYLLPILWKSIKPV